MLSPGCLNGTSQSGVVAGVGVGVGFAVVLLVVIMSVLGSGSVLCVEKAHFQNGTTCNIGKWRYGSLRQLLVVYMSHYCMYPHEGSC